METQIDDSEICREASDFSCSRLNMINILLRFLNIRLKTYEVSHTVQISRQRFLSFIH